jgi:hypothetical protein
MEIELTKVFALSIVMVAASTPGGLAQPGSSTDDSVEHGSVIR